MGDSIFPSLLFKMFAEKLKQDEVSALRIDLAAAYRIISLLRMDDLTYTHITARLPNADSFFILPFGKLFSEINASMLLEVDLDGNIIKGEEFQYNKTGYVIHGEIYKVRPDINAIFHLHTMDTVAVSAMKCGLLPISQFAMPFFQAIAYHDYNSLALENDNHGAKIAKDLGSLKNIFLRNHGTLSCGKDLQEAFFFTRFLEQACQVQVKILASNQEFIIPEDEVCAQAARDILSFEENMGTRDWQALLRLLGSNCPDYAN